MSSRATKPEYLPLSEWRALPRGSGVIVMPCLQLFDICIISSFSNIKGRYLFITQEILGIQCSYMNNAMFLFVYELYGVSVIKSFS